LGLKFVFWRQSYGLGSQGSNPDGDKTFLAHANQPWCPPRLLHNGYQVIIGGKAAGTWR